MERESRMYKNPPWSAWGKKKHPNIQSAFGIFAGFSSFRPQKEKAASFVSGSWCPELKQEWGGPPPPAQVCKGRETREGENNLKNPK